MHNSDYLVSCCICDIQTHNIGFLLIWLMPASLDKNAVMIQVLSSTVIAVYSVNCGWKY